jgi:hypothetical protein
VAPLPFIAALFRRGLLLRALLLLLRCLLGTLLLFGRPLLLLRCLLLIALLLRRRPLLRALLILGRALLLLLGRLLFAALPPVRLLLIAPLLRRRPLLCALLIFSRALLLRCLLVTALPTLGLLAVALLLRRRPLLIVRRALLLHRLLLLAALPALALLPVALLLRRCPLLIVGHALLLHRLLLAALPALALLLIALPRGCLRLHGGGLLVGPLRRLRIYRSRRLTARPPVAAMLARHFGRRHARRRIALAALRTLVSSCGAAAPIGLFGAACVLHRLRGANIRRHDWTCDGRLLDRHFAQLAAAAMPFL